MKIFGKFRRQIRYCFPVWLLFLLLTGCAIKTSQPESDGWKEENQSDISQETKRQDVPGEDYILPESDSRLYSQQELEDLTPEQIRLARNEIYARHGRCFKDNTLQVYFQSKTWYEGTVEPDIFDESCLNQTERDNITLLTRLEQGDGKLAIVPAYVEIVNANQDKRQMILSTEEYAENGESIAHQVIDHGSYYEVTNGCIFGESYYDISVMDNKTAGDTLLLNNSVYRIVRVDTEDLGNGEDVYLKYVSGDDLDYVLLRRPDGIDYYTPVAADGGIEADVLYTGSLYFSKNCLTTVNDPSNEFIDHMVSIEDYLTQDHKVTGSQHGSYPGGLSLWGGFEIDSSGLIVSYTEFFIP